MTTTGCGRASSGPPMRGKPAGNITPIGIKLLRLFVDAEVPAAARIGDYPRAKNKLLGYFRGRTHPASGVQLKPYLE